MQKKIPTQKKTTPGHAILSIQTSYCCCAALHTHAHYTPFSCPSCPRACKQRCTPRTPQKRERPGGGAFLGETRPITCSRMRSRRVWSQPMRNVLWHIPRKSPVCWVCMSACSLVSSRQRWKNRWTVDVATDAVRKRRRVGWLLTSRLSRFLVPPRLGWYTRAGSRRRDPGCGSKNPGWWTPRGGSRRREPPGERSRGRIQRPGKNNSV